MDQMRLYGAEQSLRPVSPFPPFLLTTAALFYAVARLALLNVVLEGSRLDDEPPRSADTASRNPELAHSWLISHIMTPPKLENVLL